MLNCINFSFFFSCSKSIHPKRKYLFLEAVCKILQMKMHQLFAIWDFQFASRPHELPLPTMHKRKPPCSLSKRSWLGFPPQRVFRMGFEKSIRGGLRARNSTQFNSKMKAHPKSFRRFDEIQLPWGLQ